MAGRISVAGRISSKPGLVIVNNTVKTFTFSSINKLNTQHFTDTKGKVFLEIKLSSIVLNSFQICLVWRMWIVIMFNAFDGVYSLPRTFENWVFLML